MSDERAKGADQEQPAPKGGGFFGSLKDALVAASRDDQTAARPGVQLPAVLGAAPSPPAASPDVKPAEPAPRPASSPAPSAAEAAREVRASIDRHVELDAPPTTRVLRAARQAEAPARTRLVRGKAQVARGEFQQDPVVGWLVVVGGPGLGSYRPIFEGNNTIGRAPGQRIPLDFGDDAISSEEQAYIRYDSAERSFLFVPNLAKTNVVSVNEKRPTAAVELSHMDLITIGRTQVVFVPFCGPDFDWSELAEAKD